MVDDEGLTMASAREVRAAVRADMAVQLGARQDAALAVAAAWGKVEKAQQRLADAEADAAATFATATATVPAADLATLAGVPVADVRRLARTGKPSAAAEPAAVAVVSAGGGAPTDDDPVQ